MTITSGSEAPRRSRLRDAHTPERWAVDPDTSTVAFSVRHLAVATVHGRFDDFDGWLEIDGTGRGQAHGRVDVASVDTGLDMRDRRLLSEECFDVGRHPEMTFDGKIARLACGFAAIGALTIAGRTHRIGLDGGITATDGDRISIGLGAEISRREFGLNWNALLDGGSAVVGDSVSIMLELTLVPAP